MKRKQIMPKYSKMHWMIGEYSKLSLGRLQSTDVQINQHIMPI